MQNWYFQSIVDEKFVKEFSQNCLRLARPLSCGKKNLASFVALDVYIVASKVNGTCSGTLYQLQLLYFFYCGFQ